MAAAETFTQTSTEPQVPRTHLTPGNLAGANLAGTDLAGANLAGWDLTGSDLRGTNLTGANLAGAYLTDARMQRADLTGADLRTAQLGGAALHAATLAGADATGADFTGADLTGARVDQALMRGIDLHGTTIAGLAGFETAEWVGADYAHADFAGAPAVHNVIEDQSSLAAFRDRGRTHAAAVQLALWTSGCGANHSRTALAIAVGAALPIFLGVHMALIALCFLVIGAFIAGETLAAALMPDPFTRAGSARPDLTPPERAGDTTKTAHHPLRQERLSELVSHLSGAPLDWSRQVVDESTRRTDDSLLSVADALVTLRNTTG